MLNKSLLLLYGVFPFGMVGNWPGSCLSDKHVTITVLIFLFQKKRILKRCCSYLENCVSLFGWLEQLLLETERICFATKMNIPQYVTTKCYPLLVSEIVWDTKAKKKTTSEFQRKMSLPYILISIHHHHHHPNSFASLFTILIRICPFFRLNILEWFLQWSSG